MKKILDLLFFYTQWALGSGTYSFQSYSVLQVLGASNMNQEEVNIRDHLHGSDGVLSAGHVFTNPGNVEQTLTDAATVVWNLALGAVATLVCSGAANNRSIVASNMNVGVGILHFYQSSSGTNTASFASHFKWSSGVSPSFTSTSSALDILTFVTASSFLRGSMALPDVR